MIIHDTDGIGRLEVTTIRLPEFVQSPSATYTYSGMVLVFYQQADDPQAKDYYHIAVVNDDGNEFREIFSGLIPEHKKANGLRHMPFADNRRVLLGDYVLECSPDIDNCQQAELIPVKYPWLLPLDPRIYKHWSEIIIAPDNEHISWTMLRVDTGAANCLGVLKRKSRHYGIEETQVISSLEGFKKNPDQPGYILPQVIRGGEVKQFVRGGTAISLVGAKDGYLADSVVQDLLSDEITQITRTPGYDETTIFSPDECLGIVMSPRGSQKTNLAVVGLLPRPHGRLATMGLMMYAYMYSVAGVRSFRRGNIGPVLVEIERSIHEPDYLGVQLHDPEEQWVFVSPMSWHPDGKRAMWLETFRGSGSEQVGAVGNRQNAQIRVRKVTLHDYQSQATVPVQRTPDEIDYGLKGLRGALSLWLPKRDIQAGKIAGKRSGYVEYQRGGQSAFGGAMEVKYAHCSDDGQTFFDGFEKVNYSFRTGTQYEADVQMTGVQQGEMKLRLVFSPMSFTQPPKLLFEPAEDGQPKSFGYARYNGVQLNVENLSE